VRTGIDGESVFEPADHGPDLAVDELARGGDDVTFLAAQRGHGYTS
jgi:hypothetical protein